MTTNETLVAPSAPAEGPRHEEQHRSVLQQVLDSSWTLITLAIVIALVASSVLIAAANAEVQSAAVYFFSRPADMLACTPAVLLDPPGHRMIKTTPQGARRAA